MIGVPITFPNVPTLVIVYVPPVISSGVSLFERALFAKSFTFLARPSILSWSAFLITGTIKLPVGNAAAIPILISFLRIILSPSSEQLIFGKSLIALIIASINIGVKVRFSPSFCLNLPFHFSLHCTILVTSASTYEVTCGDVCTDFTICSAISLRIRSISIISTLPP